MENNNTTIDKKENNIEHITIPPLNNEKELSDEEIKRELQNIKVNENTENGDLKF